MKGKFSFHLLRCRKGRGNDPRCLTVVGPKVKQNLLILNTSLNEASVAREDKSRLCVVALPTQPHAEPALGSRSPGASLCLDALCKSFSSRRFRPTRTPPASEIQNGSRVRSAPFRGREGVYFRSKPQTPGWELDSHSSPGSAYPEAEESQEALTA